eukprot:364768-Chlamydomonas_euryale.AAC.1
MRTTAARRRCRRGECSSSRRWARDGHCQLFFSAAAFAFASPLLLLAEGPRRPPRTPGLLGNPKHAPSVPVPSTRPLPPLVCGMPVTRRCFFILHGYFATLLAPKSPRRVNADARSMHAPCTILACTEGRRRRRALLHPATLRDATRRAALLAHSPAYARAVLKIPLRPLRGWYRRRGSFDVPSEPPRSAAQRRGRSCARRLAHARLRGAAWPPRRAGEVDGRGAVKRGKSGHYPLASAAAAVARMA